MQRLPQKQYERWSLGCLGFHGDCSLDMTAADSCVPDVVLLAGVPHAPIRGRDVDPRGRCGDGGARRGGLHHLGCDMERCPRCLQQLNSCGRIDEPAALAYGARPSPTSSA